MTNEERVISIEIENYLSLKQERDKLDSRIKELRDTLMQVTEKAGGEKQVNKWTLSIQKRESFEYVPELAKELLGQYYPIVAKVIVDKTKVKGLIKGGFITEEQLENAKNITRTTKALVIKENNKND